MSLLLLFLASSFSFAGVSTINAQNAYIDKIKALGISNVSSSKIVEIVDLIKTEVSLVISSSVSKNREYGGIIYEESGVIKTTRSKGPANCERDCFINLDNDYNSLLPKVKSGSVTIYAEWHTHPRSNFVSDDDMNGYTKAHTFLSKYDNNFMGGFYSTPASAIYLVKPGFTNSRKASKDAILVGCAKGTANGVCD